MLKKISDILFIKSPWDEVEDKENNIFTKQRKHNFNLNNFSFNLNHKAIIIAAISIVALWLFSGIYEVKEGEEAAIVRFGKFTRKGFPGLNYRMPYPFESVIIEKVNKSRRIEIGYRSGSSIRSNNDSPRNISTESSLLTGDENIIDLNCDVMWHINDLEKFIFTIVNPEEAVKTAAESAIREVIGRTPISSILSDQKQQITNKIEVLTQKILDQYPAGVSIENVQLLKAEPPAEVIASYRDVQASKADKGREINQAQSYNNDILPKARGEAAKILQDAEGYKQEVISKAEGETRRFASIYRQYSMNKQVTKDRLYLAVMEDILKGASKVIMGTSNTLPHMQVGAGNK